jgi:hypothetical protein
MPEAAGSLTERIQADLARGKSPDEIVAGLIQSGLSKPSAERLVSRAQAEPVAREEPAPVAAADSGEEAEDPGGRGGLVSGAFWFSLGSCITALSYVLTKPGGKYVLAYGALVAGLIAFGRGLQRWWDGPRASFPWLAILVAAGLPVLGCAGLVGYVQLRGHRQRQARLADQEALRVGREERARAERAAGEQQDLVAQRQAGDQARIERQAAREKRALTSLRTSSEHMGVCNAARDVGDFGLRQAIPDLVVLLRNPSVGLCAASALGKLGEFDTALAFYVKAAQGADENGRWGALGGLADLGPRAATMALPLLAQAFQSPYRDRRFVVVESLSKLGPAAEPLLKAALNDSDKLVRDHAAQALARLGGQ